MKRPPSLQFNDKAVILSPAGNVETYYVKDAESVLESWGLIPHISENALAQTGRFSGFVKQRLSDLQKAFDDPAVRLILCSRGGYGTVHLLDKLDFSRMKSNPKWVVGFSDITALHSALQANGIMSIHGPMAKHFSEEGAEDVSVRYIKSILAGQSLKYEVPIIHNKHLNRKGKASGRLFGGNLSVFCGIMGTKFVKIPTNGILFIEDIGEAPYKVDRMMHQLKLAGVFDKISALIVGQFTEYEEDNEMYGTLQESILHTVSEYSFPVCFNFPVGHTRINFPVIMGARASLTIKEDSIFFKQL